MMAGDIRYGQDISVSLNAAAIAVESWGLLERLLARQNGQPLPPSIVAMRDEFKSCLTRAASNADTSARVVIPQANLGLEQDVNAAAEALGITPDAVRWALRKGKLGGRKSGRQWLVSYDDIENYRNKKAG
jgi:excisionase family DNA binding protein